MTPVRINPLIVSVVPNNSVTITRIQPTTHKGGVGRVLGFASAILIPFAAPVIASSLLASTALGAAATSVFGATATAIGSSAIVGAGLGAIRAKIMGADVRSGALLGGIGGGIGGYSAASSGIFGAQPSNVGTQAMAQAPTASAPTVAAQAGLSTGVASADVPFTEQFISAVKSVPSAVVDKITDPATLATVTLQAGSQLLGQALAPEMEIPPEQRQLIEERRAELAALKKRDEQAFAAQMDAAKQYLRQAQQYDPTYMAEQAAGRAAIRSQRGIREQQRRAALHGGRGISAAEQRRMELDAARSVSSEYDRGFQAGLERQTRTAQAGLAAIPKSSQFSTYITALRGLSGDVQRAEDLAAQRHSTAAKHISDMFAGFNTRKSNTDEEEKKLANMPNNISRVGGLNTNSFQMT